jgi:glycine dehydrogenase
MEPVTCLEFDGCTPARHQAEGYRTVTSELENWLAEINGFQAVSLQPNPRSGRIRGAR